MTDQMIKDLAAKGGVIQINYHVGFLSADFMNADKNPGDTKAIADEVQKRCRDKEGCQFDRGATALPGSMCSRASCRAWTIRKLSSTLITR